MENKKFWFFGSKLNTVLLAVLIVLMVIALRWMSENRKMYVPELLKNNETVEKNINKKSVEVQHGLGSIIYNVDVINKITSYYRNGNIDYYIENNLPYQLKGCDSYPIKNSMVDYSYYIKIDTYVADTTLDVYDTNGKKINSCATYGVNSTTCQNIVSKIDMCETVFDTAKIFTMPKQ
ncbi:MAG: hypothetical protein ACR2IQ_01340 [Minisyncoccia bacterium]